MKSDPTQTREYGVIAQDVQKVFPEMVKQIDEEYLGVSYIQLVPVLLEAVKEQQTEIETLKAENQRLTAQVSTIETQEYEDLKCRIAKLEAILETLSTTAEKKQ